MEALQKYGGVLIRRNKLLNDMMMGDMSCADTLDVWDIQLAAYAEIISQKRIEYIKKLEGSVCDIFNDMTGGSEKPSIVYQGGYTSDELVKKLRGRRKTELPFLEYIRTTWKFSSEICRHECMPPKVSKEALQLQ